MKKLVLMPIALATIISILTACNQESHTAHNKTKTNQQSRPLSPNLQKHSPELQNTSSNTTDIFFSAIDWTTIPVTSMPGLTSFQLPIGMKITGKAINHPEQYSNFEKEVTLKIFNGQGLYQVSGNLTFFDVSMIKEEQVFDKVRFDTNTAAYLKSIGAIEFYNSVIPTEIINQLKSGEGISSYDYMKGHTEKSNLNQFILHHENGSKIIYQITSDQYHGQIGVLEISSAHEPPYNEVY